MKDTSIENIFNTTIIFLCGFIPAIIFDNPNFLFLWLIFIILGKHKND